MKPRDIVVFVVALVLAVGVAFVTRMILQTKQSDALAVQQQSITEPILIAKRDMGIGETLEKNKVTWQDWPEDSVGPYHILKNTPKIEQLYGSLVRYPLAKGEPIKASNLISVNDKSVLSAVVKKGMRAFTIALARNTHISGWLTPGDLVDVIVANRSQEKTRGFTGDTVVERVKVLAVDSDLQKSGTDKGDKVPKSITLEVTPGQAERLAAALREGKPAISLHNFSALKGDDITDDSEPSGNKVITLIRGNETSTVNFN